MEALVFPFVGKFGERGRDSTNIKPKIILAASDFRHEIMLFLEQSEIPINLIDILVFNLEIITNVFHRKTRKEKKCQRLTV